MAAIIFGSITGLLGLIGIRECDRNRKNRNMPIKMAREMKQLQYVIMKKIRNIKDQFICNLIINSEIDNYEFKTKIYQSFIKYDLCDYFIERYRTRQNLKMKMMNEDFYNTIAEQKLKTIINSYEKASPCKKICMLNNDMYAECIYYNNYNNNLKILKKRNKALRQNNYGHNGFLKLNSPKISEAGAV